MVKTYRKIQQWDNWLSGFLGQAVLQAENKYLTTILKKNSGNEAVLIGTPTQYALLKSTLIPGKLLITPVHTNLSNMRCIESNLHELPIASGSVDLVIMPHTLEHLDNPHQLLSESCRIVKPEGHIIVCGFNPYSLWGIKHFLTDKQHVWNGNTIQSSLIKKWLRLADFKLVKQSTILYRPPLRHEKFYKKLRFLEWLGHRVLKPCGGVYVLTAQAKVIPLTPIKWKWKQKISGMAIPNLGLPRPSLRKKLHETC